MFKPASHLAVINTNDITKDEINLSARYQPVGVRMSRPSSPQAMRPVGQGRLSLMSLNTERAFGQFL